MKNKIEKINDIFDKYDPCHVGPKVNKSHADEYFHVSVKYAHDVNKLGVERALSDALKSIFGEASHSIDTEAMLKDLKHAI